MPRVLIKKKDYMLHDLVEWIRMKMYSKGISQADIGRFLGISQQCVSYRFRTGSFSYKELLIIFEHLSPTDEEILKLMKV